MADIYGSRFEYGGVSSSTYGLIIAIVDTDRNDMVSGVITGDSIYNKISRQKYIIGDDTSSSPLSFDVNIVTCGGNVLTFSQRRTIEKWLFNRANFKKLYIASVDDPDNETSETIDGVVKRNYINCRFINAEKLYFNGGVVGYKATLEADSGFMWQDAITKTINLTNSSSASTSNITVVLDTDIDDYTYPKVTIVAGSSGGNIIIYNSTDDSTRMTKFVDVTPSASIIMNGNTNYISNNYYEKFTIRNFIRLVDGTNTLTVQGHVTSMTFEFNNRRNF